MNNQIYILFIFPLILTVFNEVWVSYLIFCFYYFFLFSFYLINRFMNIFWTRRFMNFLIPMSIYQILLLSKKKIRYSCASTNPIPRVKTLQWNKHWLFLFLKRKLEKHKFDYNEKLPKKNNIIMINVIDERKY